MNRRIAKQMAYGALLLLVAGGIAFAGYEYFLKPAPTCDDTVQNQGEIGMDCGGPCASCDIKKLQEPQVISSHVFQEGGNIFVLLELVNPNATYGATSFSYRIDLRDQLGSSLDTLTGASFIYPEETHYLLASKPWAGMRDVATVGISFAAIAWQARATFFTPKIEFQDQTTELQKNRIIVRGGLVNRDTLMFENVQIIALFYDGEGRMRGVAPTELFTITANEKRDFEIEHPLVPGVVTGATRLVAQAKVLR